MREERREKGEDGVKSLQGLFFAEEIVDYFVEYVNSSITSLVSLFFY
jgi:hypothetical protein